MKILIADYYGHVNCVHHASFLYKNIGDVDTAMPKGVKNKVDNSTFLFSSLLFFISLASVSHRYDKVVVLTGPEHLPGVRGYVLALSFLIFCCLFSKKIILNIRTVSSYTVRDDIKYKLIKIAAKKICKFTFESYACMNFFNKYYSNKLTFVTYIYYSDVWEHSFELKKSSGYRVGLLGAFDEDRRNYQDVVHAMRIMPTTERPTLVILGNVRKQSLNALKSLQSVCTVDFELGFLDPTSFSIKAYSCDFFISPNKRDMEYGEQKGTGAFGDAIAFKKQLLIPRFVDVEREFGDFSKYYEDSEELASLITSMKNKKLECDFSRYTSVKIAKSLVEKMQIK